MVTSMLKKENFLGLTNGSVVTKHTARQPTLHKGFHTTTSTGTSSASRKQRQSWLEPNLGPLCYKADVHLRHLDSQSSFDSVSIYSYSKLLELLSIELLSKSNSNQPIANAHLISHIESFTFQPSFSLDERGFLFFTQKLPINRHRVLALNYWAIPFIPSTQHCWHYQHITSD